MSEDLKKRSGFFRFKDRLTMEKLFEMNRLQDYGCR